MCGISGIYSISGRPLKNLESRINLMNQMLHHRGPDQHGAYISKKNNFALGNTRLAITSPNEKIKLPFTKNNINFLSFNGEVYNFEEIKKDLREKNIHFDTFTDTEVLYEFIKKFKPENLNKINGMWALAYYDENEHALTLSRDLLGEKHMFYTIYKDELIFCSEIKPILAVSPAVHELKFDSIIASWKFNACLPGKTLVNNIYRLKPGINLKFLNRNKVEKKFQKLHPEKWFDFFNANPSLETVEGKFEEIFFKAVEMRIPKDVKFFTSISGGTDSTLLAYAIKNKINHKLNAIFGISDLKQKEKPSNSHDSELSAAYQVANKVNAELNVVNLFDIFENSSSQMEKIANDALDGCLCVGTANFNAIAQNVKKRSAKVMLVSEGPDEFMGGYTSDVEAHKLDKIMSPGKPLSFLKSISKNKLGKKLLSCFMNINKNRQFEFEYEPFLSRVNHAVCPNYFIDEITENYDFTKLQEYGRLDLEYSDIEKDLDYTQKRALIYASKTLPDMYNLRLDKAFMINSVEVRLPFQALELVEFFIAMPAKYRFKNNKGKYFLRQYVSKNIDKVIGNRPKFGLGPNLYENEKIYKSLKIEEEILSTTLFKEYPFKKNIVETLLNKKTHRGNVWAAYTFIKSYNQLKQ